MASEVFVSYAREDLNQVSPLLDYLRNHGVRLWFDQEIPGGVEWGELIETKIEGCIGVLLFLSDAAIASKQVRREVKFADALDKSIVPVRLDGTELKHGLGLLLTAYQILDATVTGFSPQQIVAALSVAGGAGVDTAAPGSGPAEQGAPRARRAGVSAETLEEADVRDGAIVLSFAQEDFEVARAIFSALESAGLDVWFDRNLQLGQNFVETIKRSIQRSSLFLPLISRNTIARDARFFRLEWGYAIETAQLHPASRPFIIPVVIDDTVPTAGAIPEEFARIQWLRLPGGRPTAEFVEEVKRLYRKVIVR